MSGLLCARCFCQTKAACIANTGLLRQASVELDEPVSWHPALRANHMQAGKTCPLAGLVRSGLPGVIGVEATSCRRPLGRGIYHDLPNGTLTKSQPQPKYPISDCTRHLAVPT